MTRRLFALILLGFLLAAEGPQTQAVEKLIRVPIHTDYGITDAGFTNSISGLLRAQLVGGNHVKELLNGAEFFPNMLTAISNAQRTITFENFIWRSGEVSDRFINA